MLLMHVCAEKADEERASDGGIRFPVKIAVFG